MARDGIVKAPGVGLRVTRNGLYTNRSDCSRFRGSETSLPVRLGAFSIRDLGLIEPEEWSPHYNEKDFGGQWEGVSLRSADRFSPGYPGRTAKSIGVQEHIFCWSDAAIFAKSSRSSRAR